ncbi:sensor histidine kinase [Actinomadura gamaensis]|uniref:histidine kinase n=1 Tax=Actinomadura gamaensis TaxID=1763541 RepID=A0ABV9TVA7_9ACTN
MTRTSASDAGRAMGRIDRWWARLWVSVRGRATVLTVLVAAVVLGVTLTLVTILITNLERERVYRGTGDAAREVAARVVKERLPGPIPDQARGVRLLQIVDPQGRVLAASRELQGKPALVSDPDVLVWTDRTRCPRFLKPCVTVRGVHLANSAYGDNVMVYAAARVPGQEPNWPLRAGMALLYLVALALIAGWVWWLIGTALRPVMAIRADMVRYGLDESGRRVPVMYSGGGELQRLAETVNDTLDRLDEANTRQRRFLSDASHDLRQPITALTAELDLALAELPEGPAREGVQAALAQAERLDAIVADLLELSRLTTSAPAPVELVDLAEAVRGEVAHRHGRVPVTTKLQDGALVRANPIRLARLLNNLVSNAERHAESTVEVVVAVEGADPAVGDATVRLEVNDDGEGVAPEQRERIFSRYARGPVSQARDPGGTGLGLPIAREIARTYGGSLTLGDSALGGASFVLRLPLAPSRAPKD